jgi:hypothetical protein
MAADGVDMGKVGAQLDQAKGADVTPAHHLPTMKLTLDKVGVDSYHH